MLLLMIERGMPIDMVLTADTGMEFPEMYEHLDKLDRYLYQERGKRNQAMIMDSDICVFYCNNEYKPERRKESKRSIGTYQPKSGTLLAYEFAIQKEKEIINLFS